jgi:hypothetical protein
LIVRTLSAAFVCLFLQLLSKFIVLISYAKAEKVSEYLYT